MPGDDVAPADAPGATVLVCTRNRADRLVAGLQSIDADTSALDREIVVVDNASTDGTREAVANFAGGARHPVRYSVEPRLGHSHARNRGVAEARGQIILFTDDDTTVADGWADALVQPFEDPQVVAAGGRILPAWQAAPPAWLGANWYTEMIALRDYGPVTRDLTPDDPPIGANMAVRREALTGRPFDTALGHRGRIFMGHDEFELFEELSQQGRLAYAPDAVVMHHVPADRMTRAAIRRAAYHNGFGQTRRERRRGARLRRLPALASTPALLARAELKRWRNDRAATASTEAAAYEFLVFRELGRALEAVAGGTRWADWLSRRWA